MKYKFKNFNVDYIIFFNLNAGVLNPNLCERFKNWLFPIFIIFTQCSLNPSAL